MTDEEVFSRLTAQFPKIEKSPVQVKDYLTIKLSAPADLVPAVRFLKDELGFEYFEIVSTVDWLGPVNKEGYIREINFNTFLPEGAAPAAAPPPAAGAPYRPVFDMIWCLGNLKTFTRIFLRLEVPRETPSVPSLVGIFKAADWQEREIFDLYGITFEGHPNLIKILTPDFIVGHPLRKDYVHLKDRFDS